MGAGKVEKRSPSYGPTGSALLPQTAVVSPDDVVSAMYLFDFVLMETKSPAPLPLEVPGGRTVWRCIPTALIATYDAAGPALTRQLRLPSTRKEFISGRPQTYDSQNIPTYQDLDLRALCAGCNMKTVEDGLENNVKKPVALLDDRSRLANKQLALAGYVTNPDCCVIMVLLSTASPEQALYLTEFFYKYLGSKTSLGIHRPPRGVLSFALEFHLQFYVWREKDVLREDPRKKKSDKPLRRSFRLNFINGDEPEGGSQVCIYEAQISCLVAGLDNHSWMAYLFIDTYYQEDSSSESVEYYHSQEDLRTDPLAAGTVDSDLPIWTPREYFLVVYECRLKQVKHALQNLVSRLLLKLEPYELTSWPQLKVQDSMTLVPHPTDDGISPAQKKKIQQMLNEASRVLRQTIHSICKAVEVWDRFSSRDAAYLSDILRPRSGRPDPIPPFRVVARIGEHIDGLRDLQRLAEQQQELCAGLARELEMELVMEDNEITVQQQATGELLKTLTAIGVLFLPLTATAALFSMQPGVLPASFYTGKSFLLCWLLPTFVAVVAASFLD
ncbi:uncharacterized protein NECHADRAFT_75591 [Fusarium vanettenii 77-13-4]|uniref:Uncharacterized protein n=1 Tax=Fusarium vanettenii (strain ATCC MYA-4622 / CBS 123669 / FGSC 9596 / NRRL 45880 / 77-13-4) TaxID=660122 RepID=C7YJ85_FUSV7|nr:uncharacterized protein NECHADRAFT_75591 [Fusarium vanettenii 77-13-4]EEU48936.1 predicted protein [Fusarium vanettenii 77-13-4]